jgi:hypothetical protein
MVCFELSDGTTFEVADSLKWLLDHGNTGPKGQRITGVKKPGANAPLLEKIWYCATAESLRDMESWGEDGRGRVGIR